MMLYRSYLINTNLLKSDGIFVFNATNRKDIRFSM